MPGDGVKFRSSADIVRASCPLSAKRLATFDRWLGVVKRVAPAEASDNTITELASLASQLDALVADMCLLAVQAGVEMEELARIIREDTLSTQAIRELQHRRERRNTRTFSTYAYKHIVGDPWQEYELKKELGAGAFGTVMLAHHKRTGKDYAIKSIDTTKVDHYSLWAEVETMKELDHPHIMRLYATFADGETIFLALELCYGGAFNDALKQFGQLPEPEAPRVFKQIIGVIGYLHTKRICHRDVKPENFLLRTSTDSFSHLWLKLADFGTAKRFDLHPLVTKVCTPSFVAPEVLNRDPVEYTEKVDVWSAGVMLYQMLSGFAPFRGKNDIEVMRRVKKGRYDFNSPHVWDSISDTAKQLVQSMLCTDVKSRCTADAALHHQWTQRELMPDEIVSRQIVDQIYTFLTSNRLKRMALRIIAQQVDDCAVERLRNVFLEMDTDNTGVLNRYKMQEAVKQLNVAEMNQDGMVEIMCQLDPTGSGNVEYTEFLAATISEEQFLKEDVCKSAFDRLDGDQDGRITRFDLARLVEHPDGIRDAGLWGTSLGELISELERVMRADEDNDGGIGFSEFMKLMRSDGKTKDTSAMEKRRKRRQTKSTYRAVVTDVTDTFAESDNAYTSLRGSDSSESSSEETSPD